MSNAKTYTRRFSKRVLVVNLALVWALMFFAVFFNEAQWVVPSGFALIGLLYGAYTGVGHLDFRKFVELSVSRLFEGEPSPNSAAAETDGETG